MSSILKINNLSLRFPGLARPVLRDINYEVSSGDFIILLGHNGSGKSSLLKILDRRYMASGGEVLFCDKDLQSYYHSILAREVITLTQNYQESLFPSLTVLENCILVKQSREGGLFRINMSKEREIFAENLFSFGKELPKKLDVGVNNLSGGQQQALALALKVLYPPKVLLLDEHTSALDPPAAAKLMKITAKIVREHGITCIMSTHDLDLALNYGDKILVLNGGEVAHDIDFIQKQSLSEQDLLGICY